MKVYIYVEIRGRSVARCPRPRYLINKVITIFYDQDKVEALGKTFTNVLVFGNGISAEYSTWKSLFLGFGKVLDESWKINLEFSKPKSASIIKFKNKKGKSEQLSESLYLC